MSMGLSPKQDGRSKVPETIYQENGYINRHDYLCSIAEDYGICMDVILAIADLLGPSEDFDGLISSIQDL